MLRPRAMFVLALSLLFLSGISYLILGGTEDTTAGFAVPVRPGVISLESIKDEERRGATPVVPLRVSSARSPSPQLDIAQSFTSTTTAATKPEVDMPVCARQYFETNYQRTLVTTSDAERRMAVIPEAGIDKAYMVHYTPMKKRRIAMQNLLSQHRVNVQWVDGFDKEVLNESTAECFHAWDPRKYSGEKAKRHELRKWVTLGKSQRSVVIKHHSALYDAYRQGYQHILVLEDDAFLRVQFKKRLGEVMRSVPSTYDVIMIGGCMNMHAWRRKFTTHMLTKHIYRKREARCAHAFVASQSGVRKLLSSLPLTHAIDFQMTAAMNEQQMDVYWVEPYLSVQGPSPECVTNIDLGAPCVSVEKRIGKDFDARFANDTEADAMWEQVPAFHSKR